VDLLTGTTSGPELPACELAEWQYRRDAVNRYYASLGYPPINANRKPWIGGPYGRERQAGELFPPARNLLTTEATARLLVELATGRAVSPARSQAMLGWLERSMGPGDPAPPNQGGFTGAALPPGSRLWSKAGWTSQLRHDAALVQLPDGRRLVLVVFTEGHADEPAILHTLVRGLVERDTAAEPGAADRIGSIGR
jgi:hypothetical protein